MPLAKSCGSRHGTANLLFSSPFSAVFGFCLVTLLVRLDFFAIQGLSPKYSHLFSIVYSSPGSSLFSATSPLSTPPPPPPLTPNVGNISSLTGWLRQSLHSGVPPGLVRQGRRDEKNTIDRLGFIRALQHWFNISEQRHRWHFRWLSRDLRVGLWIFFYSFNCFLLCLVASAPSLHLVVFFAFSTINSAESGWFRESLDHHWSHISVLNVTLWWFCD